MSSARDDSHKQSQPQAAQLHLAEDRFEDRLRSRHPLVWRLTLWGPLVTTAAIVCIVAIAGGFAQVWRLALTAVATFLFFGRFIILGGLDGHDQGQFYSAEQLFALVFYMDLLTATLLAFHLEFLLALPWIGPKFRAVMSEGKLLLNHNRLARRMTFAAIILFVTFPLAATGSVGGSIFGRLLGMSRWATWICVAIGSVLGCGVMYFGAELIHRFLDRNNPLVFWGGISSVIAIILVLNHRYSKLKRAIKDGHRTTS